MTTAVIVAAGQGTRMGPGVDKLFLEVAGRPVVAHTWQRFDSAAVIDEIILVVRDGMQSGFEELAARFRFQKRFQLVAGGKERQDSVWNGLQAAQPGAEIVAIHDGARPCVSDSVIAATVQAARECGAAVAAQKVADTIKESENGAVISRHLDRAKLWAVQTPQTFRLAVILQALAQVREQGLRVTDDAAACAWVGQPVRLVETVAPNPKVTRHEDLSYLALLLGEIEAARHAHGDR